MKWQLLAILVAWGLTGSWYSFHALLTQGTGCYHRGLHSYPLIQVMGSSGTFRGWVGIEYQESDASMDNNLYHVMRKVEEGYY